MWSLFAEQGLAEAPWDVGLLARDPHRELCMGARRALGVRTWGSRTDVRFSRTRTKGRTAVLTDKSESVPIPAPLGNLDEQKEIFCIKMIFPE